MVAGASCSRPLQGRLASCALTPGGTPGQRSGARRSSYFSDEFGGDGIDEGAAMVDEDEAVAFDAGEVFIGEVGGAGAGFWTEEGEGNPFFGP